VSHFKSRWQLSNGNNGGAPAVTNGRRDYRQRNREREKLVTVLWEKRNNNRRRNREKVVMLIVMVKA